MSSNLPPGVSEGDIPGNRPIDGYVEQVFDKASDLTFRIHDEGVPGISSSSNDAIKTKIDEIIEDGFWVERNAEATANMIDNYCNSVYRVFRDQFLKNPSHER